MFLKRGDGGLLRTFPGALMEYGGGEGRLNKSKKGAPRGLTKDVLILDPS